MSAIERCLHAGEVAEILGCSTAAVYRLAKRGELPCIHVGRCVRFYPPQIAAFLAAGTVAVVES